MSTTTTEVVESPSRENIKLHVRKLHAEAALENTFSWLLKELTDLGPGAPRTLVFCKSKDDTGRINAMMLRVLGSNYYTETKDPIVHVYHRDTTEGTKATIAQNMNDPNGTIRVLLATNSAGMGVNFINTTRIVNFGPPRDMDTLVQQLGRVGRSGEKSNAFLFYNGRQMRNVESPVVAYIKGEGCRRDIITSSYMVTEQAECTVAKHDCCDICHTECQCSGDCCDVAQQDACVSEQSTDDAQTPVRTSSTDERDLLRQSLEYLQVSVMEGTNGQHKVVATDLIQGITKSVIDSVVDRCDYKRR